MTGAAGFIGSHVCERLVARGHRVTAFDGFDDYLYRAETKRATARALAALPSDRFTLVEGDILDPESVAQVIARDVDVVCHLAALAGVRPSIADPQRYVRTNVEGTGVILERMRALGLARLVFASSSSVYGARGAGEAFREDDPCVTPQSPYAATKRMNELQLSAYRDLFGLGVIALRYFTVYGPRQRPDMAIAKFVAAVAAGLPITVFGDGSTRRDYTFVDDIVSGTVAAIERVAPAQYDIVNLGGTATVSLADLVTKIEHVVGRAAVIDRQPDQPGDVPITYANVDRARALLGYEPTTRLDDGLAKYWAWMQAR
ncbi:MAG TPA: NAD-dependent epimerase/dehydratase family protein [Kofleriaceae bacterium]|nr:NAD-dependent epimerase/dehydratase family protein [Kofleriaceae bacterium]